MFQTLQKHFLYCPVPTPGKDPGRFSNKVTPELLLPKLYYPDFVLTNISKQDFPCGFVQTHLCVSLLLSCSPFSTTIHSYVYEVNEVNDILFVVISIITIFEHI